MEDQRGSPRSRPPRGRSRVYQNRRWSRRRPGNQAYGPPRSARSDVYGQYAEFGEQETVSADRSRTNRREQSSLAWNGRPDGASRGSTNESNRGDSVSKPTENWEDSLLQAVCKGAVLEVTQLVEEGKKSKPKVWYSSVSSALIKACELGHKFMAQRLVHLGASLNLPGWGNVTTALHVAVEKGHLDIASFLISKGANVNAFNKDREPPILLAIKPSGSSDMLDLLLQHKAKVHFQTGDGMTALMLAVEAMDVDAIRILLHAGSEVNRRNKRRENAKDIARRLGIGDVYEALQHEAQTHTCYGVCDRAIVKAISENQLNAVRVLLDCRYAHRLDTHLKGKGKPLEPEIKHDALWEIIRIICTEDSQPKPDPAKLEIAEVLFESGAHPDKCSRLKTCTALYEATKAGVYELVKLICKYKDFKPNRVCENRTALMLAAERGHIEILKLLLANRASPEMKNSTWDTALSIALTKGQLECASILLEHHKPLEAELQEVAIRVVKAEQLKSLKLISSHCDLKECSQKLLSAAVKSGLLEMVNFTLDLGADINDTAMANTPLALCIVSHTGVTQELMVSFLLDKGATVGRGPSSQSPLYNAVSYPAILRILLDKGADPNEDGDDDGSTPLLAACDKYHKPHQTAVELLLEAGADPNKANSFGEAPLHKAVEAQNMAAIRRLISAEADLEARKSGGLTPLLVAAGSNAPDVIALLKACGANMTAQDDQGNNAFLRAVKFDPCTLYQTLELLAYDKTQINLQNAEGNTALMLACEERSLGIVRDLLKLGADPHVVNTLSSNKTALSSLLDHIHMGIFTKECAEELIKHGGLASVPQRCCLSLLQMILSDQRKMVSLMVTNGMAPLCIDFVNSGVSGLGTFMLGLRNSVGRRLSPLGAALVRGRLPIAQYLLNNWFLTPVDVPGTRQLEELRQILMHKPDSLAWVDTYLNQPWSLAQLSFVAVSGCMGEMIGREERVRQTNLPGLLREKLLFRQESFPMDYTQVSAPHMFGPDDSYDESDPDADSQSFDSSEYPFGSEPDMEGFFDHYDTDSEFNF